jgi:aspartate racemase
MRTVGMIGGLGPESSIDYYRAIVGGYRARTLGRGYPHMLINSLDVDKGIAMLDAGQLDELTDYLCHGVEQLVRAGAEFGFIAANSPHLVFDKVQRRSAIPLVSIVRATAGRARALGFTRLGLLGTKFTMNASFYPQELQKAGVTLIIPTQSERDYIHRIYMVELLNNRFLPETRSEIMRIALRLKAQEQVAAVVLAGTELPLLLRDCNNAGIEFLDTTVIHAEAIVEELLL